MVFLFWFAGLGWFLVLGELVLAADGDGSWVVGGDASIFLLGELVIRAVWATFI